MSMPKKEVIKSCIYELKIAKEDIVACLHENWSSDDDCVYMKYRIEECVKTKVMGF